MIYGIGVKEGSRMELLLLLSRLHLRFRFIPEWQRKLPGFWYFQQELFLKLIYSDHLLVSQSHQALLDAKKMHILSIGMVVGSAQD